MSPEPPFFFLFRLKAVLDSFWFFARCTIVLYEKSGGARQRERAARDRVRAWGGACMHIFHAVI